MGAEETAAPAAKAEERLTPEEWAKRTGHVIKPKQIGPAFLIGGKRARVVGNVRTLGKPVAEHVAADQLHGWSRYTFHTGRHVWLTAEQYESALAAAAYPNAAGEYEPHQAAVPKE